MERDKLQKRLKEFRAEQVKNKFLFGGAFDLALRRCAGDPDKAIQEFTFWWDHCRKCSINEVNCCEGEALSELEEYFDNRALEAISEGLPCEDCQAHELSMDFPPCAVHAENAHSIIRAQENLKKAQEAQEKEMNENEDDWWNADKWAYGEEE